MRESEKVNYYAAFFEDKQHGSCERVGLVNPALSGLSLSLSLCGCERDSRYSYLAPHLHCPFF